MNITLHRYKLEFVFPFRIAHGVRTHTDAVFVELGCDGVRAFGEATLPPYLPYTQASTITCLSAIDLSKFDFPFDTNSLLEQIKLSHKDIEPPALAAIDMALWTLEAKMKNTTIPALLGIHGTNKSIRTYTISVCEREEMKDRIAYGKDCGFDTFKLKFNGVDDRRMLTDFRSLSDAPFAVDANQAWTDIDESIRFAEELKTTGCLLIEQPFLKEDTEKTLRLRITIDIPIIADEACQGYDDIDRIANAFSGVNIKLQKCGGITQAYKMIKYARSKGLKILIGCMSESEVGCTAAEVLAALCDWNDLDGKYLVKEVPFEN
jgi:L-alanine-DL-glutamate epimerase-like enolase superfamily enzyme